MEFLGGSAGGYLLGRGFVKLEGRLSDLAESQAMIDKFLPPDTVS